jgi:Arc/MetJ-type ribon-helix-helix transcriptional regulator
MVSKRVTVTLGEEQLERIRGLVGAGKATTVSGFVQHAVSVALDDVAGWGATLAEALRETGGPLSDEEKAWADDALSPAVITTEHGLKLMQRSDVLAIIDEAREHPEKLVRGRRRPS